MLYVSKPQHQVAQKKSNFFRQDPDLLGGRPAACHFCDHLPDDAPLQDIVKRFPFTADGRLNVPPNAAAIYLRDLDRHREPKGLKRRRQGRTSVVSMGAAYLARQTLALLRDSIDTEMAQNIWERAATGQFPDCGGLSAPGPGQRGGQSWKL